MGAASPGCFLIGGEGVKPKDLNGWAEIGKLVKKWNDENEGTSIPRPTKIVMPLTTDNDKNLRYVGVGSKEVLNVDGTIATNLNLVKAKQAFPLYNIVSESIEFRTENSKGYTLCRLIYNDKLKEKTLWRTTLKRQKARITKILENIKSIKDGLLEVLGTFPSFTYSLGNKVRIESLGDLAELEELEGDLGSHAADSISKSGRFAVASMFLDNYISKISQYMDTVKKVAPEKDIFLRKVLLIALTPVLTAAATNLKGVSEHEPYLQALKNSVKGSTIKFDSANKVLLQEFSYFPPKASDLHNLYKTLRFPLLSKDHEVLLSTPSQHVLADAGKTSTCQFIENNFLLAHCRKLDSQSYYSCQSELFGQINPCCKQIIDLDPMESLSTCGATIFDQDSHIERLDYDAYNYVYIGSGLATAKLEFICEEDPDEKELNETSIISTECNLKFNDKIFQTTMAEAPSNIITPLRSLFETVIPHIQNVVPDIRPDVDPKSGDNFFFEDNNLLSGLGMLEWLALFGSFILTSCGCTFCIGWCTFIRIKRNRTRREAQRKDNYIMVNHPGRRQTLPIYNPPSAPPPFQFI